MSEKKNLKSIQSLSKQEKYKDKNTNGIGKRELYNIIAERTNLHRKDIAKVLEVLEEVASQEIQRKGKFTIPNICSLKTILKPAQKSREVTWFGESRRLPARRASKIIKAYAKVHLDDE